MLTQIYEAIWRHQATKKWQMTYFEHNLEQRNISLKWQCEIQERGPTSHSNYSTFLALASHGVSIMNTSSWYIGTRFFWTGKHRIIPHGLISCDGFIKFRYLIRPFICSFWGRLLWNECVLEQMNKIYCLCTLKLNKVMKPSKRRIDFAKWYDRYTGPFPDRAKPLWLLSHDEIKVNPC